MALEVLESISRVNLELEFSIAIATMTSTMPTATTRTASSPFLVRRYRSGRGLRTLTFTIARGMMAAPGAAATVGDDDNSNGGEQCGKCYITKFLIDSTIIRWFRGKYVFPSPPIGRVRTYL